MNFLRYLNLFYVNHATANSILSLYLGVNQTGPSRNCFRIRKVCHLWGKVYFAVVGALQTNILTS